MAGPPPRESARGGSQAAPVALSRVTAHALGRLAARETSSSTRLWLPLASILATLVVVDVSASVLPGGGAFLLLLLPVMLSAMIGGTGAGLLILLLGAIGSVALVLLRGHPWLSSPVDVSRILLYVAVGGFMVLVVAALRAAVRGRERSGPTAIRPPTESVERLTRREVEILRLAASGLSVDDIGQELHLSRNTVKSHLAGAYGKLGAHNRAQAISAGLRSGYLDVENLRDPSST